MSVKAIIEVYRRVNSVNAFCRFEKPFLRKRSRKRARPVRFFSFSCKQISIVVFVRLAAEVCDAPWIGVLCLFSLLRRFVHKVHGRRSKIARRSLRDRSRQGSRALKAKTRRREFLASVESMLKLTENVSCNVLVQLKCRRSRSRFLDGSFDCFCPRK